MVTASIAATFDVTRRELLGPDALLGAAEIARGVCRAAGRGISLLVISHHRMRRIDGWITDDGFVTHPIAPVPDRAVIGTVCGRDQADELVGSIVEALVGPIPNVASREGIEVGAVGALSPSVLPTELEWVLVVTAVAERGVERWVAAAHAGGLVGAAVADPLHPCRLDPIGPMPNWSRIARLLDGAAGHLTIVSPSTPEGGPS